MHFEILVVLASNHKMIRAGFTSMRDADAFIATQLPNRLIAIPTIELAAEINGLLLS